MGCLYIIEGPKNYIGITSKDVSERFAGHVAGAHKNARSYLPRAIRKYGAAAFSIRALVFSNDWTYLCLLERAAILSYKTKAPAGYNATVGGDGVIDLDAETKEKHRQNTSVATAKAWANGSLRVNRAESRARPEFKENHRKATSDGVKRMYEDPVKKAKTLAALKSPAKREKSRSHMVRLWANPDYRAKQIAKRLGRRPRSVESKRLQGEKMKLLISERKQKGTYWL